MLDSQGFDFANLLAADGGHLEEREEDEETCQSLIRAIQSVGGALDAHLKAREARQKRQEEIKEQNRKLKEECDELAARSQKAEQARQVAKDRFSKENLRRIDLENELKALKNELRNQDESNQNLRRDLEQMAKQAEGHKMHANELETSLADAQERHAAEIASLRTLHDQVKEHFGVLKKEVERRVASFQNGKKIMSRPDLDAMGKEFESTLSQIKDAMVEAGWRDALPTTQNAEINVRLARREEEDACTIVPATPDHGMPHNNAVNSLTCAKRGVFYGGKDVSNQEGILSKTKTLQRARHAVTFQDDDDDGGGGGGELGTTTARAPSVKAAVVESFVPASFNFEGWGEEDAQQKQKQHDKGEDGSDHDDDGHGNESETRHQEDANHMQSCASFNFEGGGSLDMDDAGDADDEHGQQAHNNASHAHSTCLDSQNAWRQQAHISASHANSTCLDSQNVWRQEDGVSQDDRTACADDEDFDITQRTNRDFPRDVHQVCLLFF
jgi:hypothetical protein